MKTLLLLQCLCVSFYLHAQTTLEVVYYKPLEAAGGGYLEQDSRFILQCSAQASLFTALSYDVVESSHQIDDNNYAMNIWWADDEPWYYKDLLKNELTQYAVSMQDTRYIVQDVIHPMTWEILEEIRNIGGIPVQKARCEHRGRTYTAWFAPSIPLNNGPWKLGGLPGLILEAYDDEKQVVFLFKSLKQLPAGKIVMPDTKGRKVPLETYLELNEKETKQYLEFIEARMKSASPDTDMSFKFKIFSWEFLK